MYKLQCNAQGCPQGTRGTVGAEGTEGGAGGRVATTMMARALSLIAVLATVAADYGDPRKGCATGDSELSCIARKGRRGRDCFAAGSRVLQIAMLLAVAWVLPNGDAPLFLLGCV